MDNRFVDRNIGGTKKRLEKKYVVTGWVLAIAVAAALVIGLAL